MFDPRIARDPIRLIRQKNKDGSFILLQEECERWVELVLFDRAIALWNKEKPLELEELEKLVRGLREPARWKPTGRGKLFWIDSE